MKHTSKRLQALVLVLAMCVSFLQIPSFATACISGDKSVVAVDIAKDGTITVTKRCKAHLNEEKADCEETVNGKIGVKVKEDGNYEADSSKTDVSKLGLNATDVTAICTDATCKDAGSVKYTVKIAGETREKTYTTVAATGKHAAITEQEAKMDFNALAAAEETEGTFKCVSNTATCKATGKATFKKYCAGCKNYVEAITVDSPILKGHKYIQEEQKDKNGKVKLVDKVFTEEITAATCGKVGKEYKYVQCEGCGAQYYYTDEAMTTTSDVKGNAFKFDIPTLPHTFEYKIALNNGYDFVTKTTKTDTDLFKVDSKCTVCSDDKHTEEDHLAKVTKVELVADKTVEPKFDCVAGSKTYKVTYKVTDYSKEKVNNQYQTKEVVEEVTVPYYNNYYHRHDRTDVYVPDEESYVKATCTKDGHYNMVNPCKVCGDKEVVATVKIPATGKHTAAAAKKENVVAATTKKGGSYDLVVRCADCGKVLSKKHKTTAKIVVKASKVTKATNVKGKKAKITVKKAASVTGYQIQYGTKKNFKGAKAVNTKATTKTVSKLAKNKKYYVRVRTYKTVDGKTYYSSWSGAKTVTIKK